MLVLKREPSVIFKAKSNPSVYILACQILLLALRDSHDWSESIAKVRSCDLSCYSMVRSCKSVMLGVVWSHDCHVRSCDLSCYSNGMVT